jgi:RNA polymerase sigma-70 factor (ECF subfamily)
MSTATLDDEVLLGRLRAGDEAGFTALVERYHRAMIGVALGHVRTRALAEEVVQDAWVGVLGGLDRFEGRSSLRTWIFRILLNQAKTRGVREARTLPAETAGRADPVAPDADDPEARVLAGVVRARVGAAVEALPPRQRRVITLRDLEGRSAAEVCRRLGISEGNQRVLLHRARRAVRAALAG